MIPTQSGLQPQWALQFSRLLEGQIKVIPTSQRVVATLSLTTEQAIGPNNSPTVEMAPNRLLAVPRRTALQCTRMPRARVALLLMPLRQANN